LTPPLQVLNELNLMDNCNAVLLEVAAELEAAGDPDSLQLAALAHGASFLRKRYPYEAFDAYLRLIGADSQAVFNGLGVQHHMAAPKQHWAQERQERSVFKAQEEVVRHNQVAVLSSSYSLWALLGSELPGGTSAAAQATAEIEEELHMVEEDEGLQPGVLTLQDAQGPGVCPWGGMQHEQEQSLLADTQLSSAAASPLLRAIAACNHLWLTLLPASACSQLLYPIRQHSHQPMHGPASPRH